MNEHLTNQENPSNEAKEVQSVENDIPADAASEGAEVKDTVTAIKSKFTKKQLMTIAAAAVAVIAIALVAWNATEFVRVKSKCLDICGGVSSNSKGTTFTLDTDPYDGTQPFLVAYSSVAERTLDAIQYANEALGFPTSVYSQMLNTNALMGVQTAESDKYYVSWTYHPDNGLEVTYEKK